MRALNRHFFLLLLTAISLLCAGCALPGSSDPVSASTDCATCSPTEESSVAQRMKGFWKLSDDYLGDRFSEYTFIEILPEEQIWYSYDIYGNASEPHACLIYGSMITLYTGKNSLDLLLHYDSLLDSSDAATVYLPIEQPRFEEAFDDYDGVWYLNGDKSTRDYYTISGTQFRHYQSVDGVNAALHSSGVWKSGSFQLYGSDGSVACDISTIELPESLLTFHMARSGLVCYADESLNYAPYIHESAIGTPVAEDAMEKYRLMNLAFSTEPDEDGLYLRLRLKPYAFEIVVCSSRQRPGNESSRWSGLWNLTDLTHMELQFFDREAETVELSEAGFYLSSMGAYFAVR